MQKRFGGRKGNVHWLTGTEKGSGFCGNETVYPIRLQGRGISGKAQPFALRRSGDGPRRDLFPAGRKPSPLSSPLGPLYHNGTALYQNDAATRDILYALNGRRTNHARIGDRVQIFVCSPQYIGEGQIFDPTNCK
ncbi:MAG TPA: hypothetical protein VMU78_04350 [Methylocella sp.]|nr:hypothetical protein [Methylocella sp.]